MKKYTYTFNRLRENDENILKRFMCFSHNESNLNADDYYTECHGTIEMDEGTQRDACEELFYIYNIDRPEGYTGCSMSVSDIVELWDNDGEEPIKTTWYCDNIGFVQLIEDADGRYKRA